MARILDIKPEDYLSFTRSVCEKAVAEKLSWVALAESTAPLYSDFNLNPKFFPLFALLEELDNRYLIATTKAPEEIFHLYMLGVLPAYSGHGIGRELLKGSVNFAREKGFTIAVAEATGVVSQSLCRSLGFETKASVAYDSFVFAGGRPFRDISEPRCCTLVERVLCQP
jgi:GNAT superfamily N-acetyltransferase